MNQKLPIYRVFIFATLAAFANIRSSWAECASFETPQSVLDCALTYHPVVQQTNAKVTQGKYLVDVAGQRPNPELEAGTGLGRADGQGVLNAQVSLLHTFELGGKRDARLEKARADNQVIATQALKAKEEVALGVVTALFRLRQLQVERDTLGEALSTFEKIKSQLKARPRLTPDQEVAFTTFQLIASDYQVRKQTLTGEEHALLNLISLSTGTLFEANNRVLPQPKGEWPDFKLSVEASNLAGSDVSRLRADLKDAEASLKLAQSAAWPNLRIGPMFQAESQAGVTYQAYGLNLTLPLPFYQANGGGIAFAESGLSRAEITRNTGELQLQAERQQEILRYQAALRALQESGTLREVEKRHQDIERLFRSGLIQSSMVIEAHRQVVDLTRNVNEQELQAIRSLWRIYAIEGRVLKEKI